jgi:hypothetical protein
LAGPLALVGHHGVCGIAHYAGYAFSPVCVLFTVRKCGFIAAREGTNKVGAQIVARA